ncbi:MAG: hypothetical protein HKN18_18640 [Silicimonas sp.]|nr:hypothetical protein [Silicimonas sp.]
MDQLIDFPITDSSEIADLRTGAPMFLGLALARAGCSVEATYHLRPTRKDWKENEHADEGKAALETMTWWNKSWRDVAQLVQSQRYDEALGLLRDRVERLWDQPPLLLHLAGIARETKKLHLARHLLGRVVYLCDRGLPKTKMTAFRYAAEAGLVDVLIEDEDIPAALNAYKALTPNPGNAMSHELQGASLMALSGHDDAAMAGIAQILLTANRDRTGWSSDIRRDFVERAPELAHLRNRADWSDMSRDPASYLKAKASR